jgi:N-acetylmuramoyl-L-alanine amidase
MTGVTGAHTAGWNSGAVGVALLGTLTSRDATPAARDALNRLLAWEASRNGINPEATKAFVNPVSGANDHQLTSRATEGSDP